MNDSEDKVRSAIAEHASERFVAHDAGQLAEPDAVALASWFQASPINVEEFLCVSAIARDLVELKSEAAYSIDALIRDASGPDESVPALGRVHSASINRHPFRPWRSVAAALAACIVASLGLYVWQARQTPPGTSTAPESVVHLRTRHGEFLTRRLADNSMLYLNTDSAIEIRYGSLERRLTLTAGEANFEVAHEARPFRVLAGAAEVVDIGTKFDVRLKPRATVVTVSEGRVALGAAQDQRAHPQEHSAAGPTVEVTVNQQATLISGEWPPTLTANDAQSTTSWLHRQITFDHEPLENVALEYNRYAPKPIEIVTPALRSLEISGIFAADDPAEFIAFLRSLKGVRVEVTASLIRVFGE